MKKRKQREKELEGIDMSNIVTSSRRRSATNFVVPPKPKVPIESDSDDAEDTDEGDEDDDDNDDEEEENEEDGSKSQGEDSNDGMFLELRIFCQYISCSFLVVFVMTCHINKLATLGAYF